MKLLKLNLARHLAPLSIKVVRRSPEGLQLLDRLDDISRPTEIGADHDGVPTLTICSAVRQSTRSITRLLSGGGKLTGICGAPPGRVTARKLLLGNRAEALLQMGSHKKVLTHLCYIYRKQLPSYRATPPNH